MSSPLLSLFFLLIPLYSSWITMASAWVVPSLYRHPTTTRSSRQQRLSPPITSSQTIWLSVSSAEPPDEPSPKHQEQERQQEKRQQRRRPGRDANRNKNSGTSSSSSSTPAAVTSIYSLPALYDLAFGYRDYESEVQCLLNLHERVAGRSVRSTPTTPTTTTTTTFSSSYRILELAAGPARHSLTALTGDFHVDSVTCIDLSPEMAAYANQLADELIDDHHSDRAKFHYHIDDIRSLSTLVSATTTDETLKFDTAWLLLGSLQHLTENDDVVACLQAAHAVLKDNAAATLIVELPHPRETFTMVECTRNEWEIPLQDETGQESGELKILWGNDDDIFDPIRQVRQFTVAMQVTGMEKKNDASAVTADLQNIRQVVPMRLFTAQEIDALARCAGFTVAAMVGALDGDEEVAVDDEDAAFRLVCVLRKVAPKQ